MPGECGSRKTKKGERAGIRGIKTESAWRGIKTYRKKAEEVKYRNKSWAVYKEMAGGAAVWRYCALTDEMERWGKE